jgi:RNA polymerase sigma-32 factor
MPATRKTKARDEDRVDASAAADAPDGAAALEPDEIEAPEPARAEVVDADEAPSRGLARRRDLVQAFLTEARRYPRLSEEDERSLGTAVRTRGDMDAARKLVVHNLRLVVAIAYQYRRAWTNIRDLFQEGSVGLMEAVKRWEPTLGPRFGSYAAYWIRAYVLKFLLTNSRLVHVGNTRAGRKLFFRLEKERQKLAAAGIEPTPKLLAAKLEVDEKELDEVRQHLESREVSLEPRASRDGDGTYSLAERLAGGGENPEEEAAHAELSDAVKKFDQIKCRKAASALGRFTIERTL